MDKGATLMTHCYHQPITVSTTPQGQPHAFTWRGREYRVLEILATWHLRDRWWRRGALPTSQAPGGQTRGASDRTYYRVRCADEFYGELYYDAACDCWVLDRIYD